MSRLHNGIRIGCLLTIAVLLMSGVGTTYARYRSTREDTLLFEAQGIDPAGQLTITSATSWVTTAESAALQFAVTDQVGSTHRQVYLRLTATEGFSAALATVTLTAQGTAYTATAHPIEAGDPLYDKMGPGTEYRFYVDGQEHPFGVNAAQDYTLLVEGEAEASLLRLTATEA